MKLKLEITKQAQQDLAALEEKWRGQVLKAFPSLAKNPRPEGSRALPGSTHLFQLRIGKIQAIYEVDDHHREIHILAVQEVGRGKPASIWQQPKIRALLAQPVGAPIELTRAEALAIAKEAFGSRPDLPTGKEYVRRVKSRMRGLAKKRDG